MEPYVVSARKYRPQTFQSVVGQSVLTTTLKTQLLKTIWHMLICFVAHEAWQNHLCYFCQNHQLHATTARRRGLQHLRPCKGFNEQRSFNIHELMRLRTIRWTTFVLLLTKCAYRTSANTASISLTRCTCSLRLPSTPFENARRAAGTRHFYTCHNGKHKIIPTILSMPNIRFQPNTHQRHGGISSIYC